MPTVSSIRNRRIAMFTTHADIMRAAPVLRHPKYQSLALEHYFHAGDSLRSITQRLNLPTEAIALLDQNFAFGAMLFRGRPEMMDWLVSQSASSEREIFGYYHRNGSGLRLWANMGWASAAPALTTRKWVFHTHPSGGHDLSGGDVFAFLSLKNQIGMTVASGTGVTTVVKAHPELANRVGDYLRGLASTWAIYHRLSSPDDPNLIIREARFSDIPVDAMPSIHSMNGQNFALQILSEAMTGEHFDLKRLMLYSGLEIEHYSQACFKNAPSKPKHGLVSKLTRDFLRDPLGIYLKLQSSYVPYDAIEIEPFSDSPDATAVEIVDVNGE